MQTILTQLRREEDDLVGHRGLLPGTEQQTFQIIIPTALRMYYNKVMSPMNIVSDDILGIFQFSSLACIFICVLLPI